MYPTYPHSHGAYGPYSCSAKVFDYVPCQLNILEHETHTHTYTFNSYNYIYKLYVSLLYQHIGNIIGQKTKIYKNKLFSLSTGLEAIALVWTDVKELLSPVISLIFLISHLPPSVPSLPPALVGHCGPALC